MGQKKNKNKKNKERETNDMKETLLYEVKFFETEDGYRLEASGDKALLRGLGIGPRMLGRRKRPSARSAKRQMRRRRAARQRGRPAGAPGHYPGSRRGLYQSRRQGGWEAFPPQRTGWNRWPRNFGRWDANRWDDGPGSA